ncbi:MAG TPA: glycosyl hydrolase [Streptosporangiaceae bacterium]|nr:glycosyl hydrolase [Streptosporangiaceae bacterium]
MSPAAASGRSARGTRRRLRRGTGLPAALAFGMVLLAACAGQQRAAGTGSPAASHRCAVTAILEPTCGAWWGMYLPTDPGGDGLTAAVAAQERSLGRPLDIIERYHDMSDSGNGIFPNKAEAQLARHHLLLFSWGPAVWSAHTGYRWSVVASGVLDRSVIVPEAGRLRAFGHTVFLAFSQEPDGGVPGTGSPAQFVAAWRHVHDVFARLGVRNVVWVWTTTGYVPRASTIAALYPGSAYVDWIGYDPYNFFSCHHSPWYTFAQTVQPFYQWLAAHHLGAGKPLMLQEFGSAPDPAEPGREAAWFRGIVPVLRGLPRLKALILWNSATRGCDLKLSSASAAGTAYRQAGLAPYLRQALP